MTPNEEKAFINALSQKLLEGIWPNLQQFLLRMPGLSLQQVVQVQWDERGDEPARIEQTTLPQLMAQVVEELRDLNTTLDEIKEKTDRRRRKG